ncbi:RNA 2',3'-cyclic phosphodiesterase [Phycicoccus sp. CSK15P-2]|uniref:RNA 2',3'-cyclic phosphodiesterase n=1 Tax=Phycicoccus sp. CSK15P-2 TaxID=2807627 RepID=UPI00194DCCDC|nr:RNA 2',3'-cyclic phosphodiesterase [Phycicoccus sp. CSK15P-2]MBM6404282.1 RNA 2',3'-cyclic phosphodiesterase [Phycicoccus sp. CSK15P-2]
MRFFVAVVPSSEALDDLERFLLPRRDAEGPRWSRREQWHVTLAFAGAAPERVAERLVEAVGEVTARAQPVLLALGGGGCFPDVTRARVLYTGVRGAEALSSLAHGVRAACSVAGAAPEGGRFTPHVTIGRFSQPVEATRWVRVLETYAGPAWTASEVVVVESHLSHDHGHPSRYEVLARLPLG